MDKIREMQYQKFREDFNEMVKSILGTEDSDVFRWYACKDIIRKFNLVKTEMCVWRFLLLFTLVLWLATNVFS